MRIPLQSNNEPLILALTLKSKGNANLRIRVADAYRPNTIFTDRVGVLNGERTFYVRMPHSGKRIVADIFEPGFDPTAPDKTFELVSKEILDIERFPNAYNSTDPLVKSAMRFIEQFSFKAGGLGAGKSGSVYLSDDGHFRIDYMDVIIDRAMKIAPDPNRPDFFIPNPNYGRELTTPARISQDRGVIEVSKKYFLAYPFPQRVAILAHEVRHYYFNKTQADEKEADEGAVNMTLGYGYSDIDVFDAFNAVFKNAPSDENKERSDELLQQITEFGAKNYKYK